MSDCIKPNFAPKALWHQFWPKVTCVSWPLTHQTITPRSLVTRHSLFGSYKENHMFTLSLKMTFKKVTILKRDCMEQDKMLDCMCVRFMHDKELLETRWWLACGLNGWPGTGWQGGLLTRSSGTPGGSQSTQTHEQEWGMWAIGMKGVWSSLRSVITWSLRTGCGCRGRHSEKKIESI